MSKDNEKEFTSLIYCDGKAMVMDSDGKLTELKIIDTSEKIITDAQPCPYCGGTEIRLKLKRDCYSSWIEVDCQKCYAHIHVGSDKNDNDSFPNPILEWKERGLKCWNDPNTEIEKKTILKLKRGEFNNPKGIVNEMHKRQRISFSINDSLPDPFYNMNLKGEPK